jgi:glycosyltransferase involved in cell wall biosynthesis
MINSVYDYVDEVIAVDTGSTDNSWKNLGDYKKLKLYKIGFSDFGSIRTLTAHLATKSWILMLDADETLERPDLLFNLTQNNRCCAYAFPRKRWLDLEKTQQTEQEAYPDLQVRFYRNNPKFTWKRELHEYFDGGEVTPVFNGIFIHHFEDIYHNNNPERLKEKMELYTRLSEKAGVEIQGGKEIK